MNQWVGQEGANQLTTGGVLAAGVAVSGTGWAGGAGGLASVGNRCGMSIARGLAACAGGGGACTGATDTAAGGAWGSRGGVTSGGGSGA